MSVREVYEAACKRADENWRMFLESQAQLAEARKELELLRSVVGAAKQWRQETEDYCGCGYITEDATEETGPNICGMCAMDDALREWEAGRKG